MAARPDADEDGKVSYMRTIVRTRGCEVYLVCIVSCFQSLAVCWFYMVMSCFVATTDRLLSVLR